MKKIILYSAFILINLFSSSYIFSIDPEYDVKVKFFKLIAPNILEFEIYMIHTNPLATSYEYSMGQYIFTFNTAYANGGTLTYTHSPDPNISDLPASQIPTCPKIYNDQLRLTTLIPPGPGNGFYISNMGDGTKIVRMRLTTTACSFLGNLNLTWKLALDYYTKIFSYIGTKPTNISATGTYTIDPFVPTNANNVTVTPSPENYLTLADAFTAINNGIHGNNTTDVIVNINASTFETNTPILFENVFNTCVIRPTANVTVSPSPCAANLDALILLLGSDKVTVNGNIAGIRSLTLKGEGRVTNCIKMEDGANDNVIENIVSENSTGVNIKISSPATTGNSKNRIENCVVNGGTKGISITGNASFTNDENKIIKNDINNCSATGIAIAEYTMNSIVTGNKIFNTSPFAPVSSTLFTAISFYGNGKGGTLIPPNTISQNKIYDMSFTNALLDITGIDINPANDIETILNVNNNFISLSEDFTNATEVKGIYTYNIDILNFTENIYHNTIFIEGTTGLNSCESYCIVYEPTRALASTVIYNQRNNISINERTGGIINLASYIEYSGGTTVDADYNCYWSKGKIANWNGNITAYRNLPEYKCRAFPHEQNTLFKDVNFADEVHGDLHLTGTSVQDLDLAGVPISGITGDFDLVTGRSTTAPYIGADEDAPFYFNGKIRVTAYIDGYPVPSQSPVDVIIEIRDNDGVNYNHLGSSPYSVTLSTSGTAVVDCPAAISPPSGEFYIVIKRPGCLETWSKNGGETMSTIAGAYLNYDFTTGPSQAYEGNMKYCGCKSYIFNGDIVVDGVIDIWDYEAVLNDALNVNCAPYGTGGGSGVPTLGNPTDLTNNFPLRVDCDDLCLISESVEWIPLSVSDPLVGIYMTYINRPPGNFNGTYYPTQVSVFSISCLCTRPH